MTFAAILERSAGNAETGQAWSESRTFPIDASVRDVWLWAKSRESHEDINEPLRGRLMIQINDNPSTPKLSDDVAF